MIVSGVLVRFANNAILYGTVCIKLKCEVTNKGKPHKTAGGTVATMVQYAICNKTICKILRVYVKNMHKTKILCIKLRGY